MATLSRFQRVACFLPPPIRRRNWESEGLVPQSLREKEGARGGKPMTDLIDVAFVVGILIF